MQQAARVSDRTAFFWLGKLVEYGRDRQDLHQPVGEADRGLRHGKVRLMARARRPAFPGGARAAEDAAARDGRAGRGPRPLGGPGPGRARRRARRPRAGRRRRRSTSCTSRSTTAASSCWRCTSRWRSTCARSSSAVKINTDLERVGDLAVNIAEAVTALHAAPAGQGADRHPADGRHRPAHAARRARRLRPPRHRAGAGACSTRTTRWTR